MTIVSGFWEGGGGRGGMGSIPIFVIQKTKNIMSSATNSAWSCFSVFYF